jgi:hypothetical protein
MLFSKKSKGYFVEFNEHNTLIACTSTQDAPLLVEEVKSCPAGNSAALESLLREFQPKRAGAGGYLHATCGLYPKERVVRRVTLDPKRFKDAGYLNEVVSGQLKVEPDKYTLAALDAESGIDFDLNQTAKKEVLIAGLPNAEVSAEQKRILKEGVYPNRVELGTVATLGALVDYLKFSKSTTPTLVLEMDADSTQSYILSESGVDISRSIPQGLDAMVPVVQKELGLKDEEAARKLFYSNTFDFTGMGAVLIKKLLKELQSSIGFYEVQTGQSIGQLICTLLPSKLNWLEGAIANQLGVGVLKVDYSAWLKARNISVSSTAASALASSDIRWLGLFSLMIPHHAIASEEKS